MAGFPTKKVGTHKTRNPPVHSSAAVRFHAFYHEEPAFPYTVGMSPLVRITRASLHAMQAHARREGGLECCGLLGGRGGVITTVLPAKNALASATAYEIAPKELFELFQRMRRLGLEHLGIYHSHPAGDNAPSPSDIERAYYPEAAYVILSPLAGAANPVRAFSIRDERVEELAIEAAQG
jgi:[CysO sulfur-carrier protein]-S-L-cysteine hydrolase